MQALIVLDDPDRRLAVAAALAREGFDVACVADPSAAKRHARACDVDLLVLDERVDGRLSHDVVLLAEWRNPCLAAVVVADRDGPAADELFALIPSVRAVAPSGTAPATLARAALDAHAATAGERTDERLARLWAEAGGDDDEAQGPDAAAALAVPSFLRRPASLALFDPVDVPAALAARPAHLPRRLHLS